MNTPDDVSDLDADVDLCAKLLAEMPVAAVKPPNGEPIPWPVFAAKVAAMMRRPRPAPDAVDKALNAVGAPMIGESPFPPPVFTQAERVEYLARELREARRKLALPHLPVCDFCGWNDNGKRYATDAESGNVLRQHLLRCDEFELSAVVQAAVQRYRALDEVMDGPWHQRLRGAVANILTHFIEMQRTQSSAGDPTIIVRITLKHWQGLQRAYARTDDARSRPDVSPAPPVDLPQPTGQGWREDFRAAVAKCSSPEADALMALFNGLCEVEGALDDKLDMEP